MDNKLNIPFEDFLHCESFYSLCDYSFADDPNQDLPTGIVNCDIQGAKRFLERIKEFPDRKYVIVSSRSDYGLAYQAEYPAWKDLVRWVELMVDPNFGYRDVEVEARVKRENCKITDKYSIRSHYMTSHTFPEIPPNVVKWYSTNLHIGDDPRLVGLPFGLNCTDNKIDGIQKIFNHKYNDSRDKLLYLNFSLNTFDRVRVRAFYKNHNWVTIKDNVGPQEYLDDLASHKFCLCPYGVGLDTYRLYECIYMGCIPLIEHGPLNFTLQPFNLPIFSVQSMINLKPSELQAVYQLYLENINNFDLNPIKASFWRSQIEESRKLL